MPYPPDADDEPIEIPACAWPPGHPVAAYPQGFYDFVALFNDGQHYECHETLEAVWLDTQGPEKGFYQGLIHVATAFHHVRRRNMKGARLLLRSGHELLGPYADGFHHFPVAALRELCEAWFPLVDAAWRAREPIDLGAAPIPPIELCPAPDGRPDPAVGGW